MKDVEKKMDEMLALHLLSREDLTSEELEQLRQEAQLCLNGAEYVDGILFTKDIYRKSNSRDS